MKTAVEWLIEEMIFRLAIRIENTIDGVKLLEEAKELEKQQIIDSYNNGCIHTLKDKMKKGEQYYNEHYAK